MRSVFLTSSPTGPLDGSRPVEGLDEMNDFVVNLKKVWNEDSRCLMITAAPDSFQENDEMTAFFAQAVEKSGLSIASFDLWDDRTENFSKEILDSYDVIFLGGGHVPTQNAFFRRIGLREKIQDFDGIIIGISAGSMNSADIVYAQPELDGESVDENYKRYLRGLNLTKTMILPHYQMVKDRILDGKRLYEDITYPDSMGKEFLLLADGSYLRIIDGIETVWGDAWRLKDGKKTDARCGDE